MMQSMDSKWRYPVAVVAGIAAGGYIGAMLATGYAMFVFGESLNTIDYLNPWFLKYPYSQITASPAVQQLVWTITATPAIIFVIFAVTSVHRGRLTRYDDAHFQTRRELRKNKMSAPLSENGFLFGKLGKPKKKGAAFVSAKPDRFPHAIMIAPTGRGKGIGFVLPNLLHFDGSAVILDVKGENFEKTSIHRLKHLKNQVWYFSPFDYVTPEGSETPFTRTHRFNPLARIAALPSQEQQYTAINTMADLFLIVESVNAQSFFQAGRSLFVASCLYAIETGNPTIGEALRIMSGGGSKKDAYRDAAEATSNPVVAEVFLSMADETDKILDSYVSVIRGAGLELWLDPAVDRATSASDFDFGTFRKDPQSLYIVVQPEHLKTLAPLIRLLFADAIACLQRSKPTHKEKHTVMFLMDEFDQLGKQPLVLNSIKTIRSYGGRFFIITQSIPGLEQHGLYSETDRRALMAGAGVHIYMTPQDDRTADVLSAALGKRTIESKTRSQSVVRSLSDSSNISRRSEERPLVSPAELLRFDLSKVLILPEGQYPIIADHIRYFEDAHFQTIDQARHGHKLPYPALSPPTTRSLPRMRKSVAEAQPSTLSDEAKAEAADGLKIGYSTMKVEADSQKRGTASQGGRREAPVRAPMPSLSAFKDEAEIEGCT